MQRKLWEIIDVNDTDAHLRQSFRARNEQRLSQFFETKTKERTKKASPKMKDRTHTTAMENIEGDLDRLLQDAKLWQEGQQINWSKKGRLHN